MNPSFSQNVEDTPEKSLLRRSRDFNAIYWRKGIEFSLDNSLLNLDLDDPSTISNYKKSEISFQEPKKQHPRVEGFRSEQEFEGFVTSTNEENRFFWARLTDSTNPAAEDEEVEFNFEEVPSDDWSLIMPGALFSWNIGLEYRNRQVKRVSDIRFRRYFQFSQENIDIAEAKAIELVKAIESLNDIK